MRTLKVYLAAPYPMKDVINGRAFELRASGITVTSSWLDEPHKPTTQMGDLIPDQHRAYAIQDVNDVVAADILVFQTDETKTILRAGRHVEFGIAIGIGIKKAMPIFVVGEDFENIFHYLPQVTHFKTWDVVRDLLKHLNTVNQE